MLQIRSTPLGQGLLSHMRLLFNCTIKGIILILSRPPIHANSDNYHHETLVEIKSKAVRNYDTLRNYNSVPIGSTVVVQRQDQGLWTHGTIVEKGDQNMTKKGQLIARKSKHVNMMPITSEQYLRH